jgi:hypothetical protein
VSEAPRFPELRKAILENNLPTFIRMLADVLTELRLTTRKEGVVVAEEFVSLVVLRARQGRHRDRRLSLRA